MAQPLKVLGELLWGQILQAGSVFMNSAAAQSARHTALGSGPASRQRLCEWCSCSVNCSGVRPFVQAGSTYVSSKRYTTTGWQSGVVIDGLLLSPVTCRQ
eukprot:139502-Pelagomonas_calceolata.AAC.5